jgi:hypothetical protein
MALHITERDNQTPDVVFLLENQTKIQSSIQEPFTGNKET